VEMVEEVELLDVEVSVGVVVVVVAVCDIVV
jgi:hypothetical protein